ncbi:expressed unknown protein [Seminavis robusta]|uniref:Uncharacterized protein n=1 Tax=Seminavis robusta TaxID=568900 RepID=A0A9N8EFK8_9STRA|nr:expressed unknown protein [Seminavis robusta]|eukprot:Sro1007_g230461.1  (117) ;mRNA; r:33267-33617
MVESSSDILKKASSSNHETTMLQGLLKGPHVSQASAANASGFEDSCHQIPACLWSALIHPSGPELLGVTKGTGTCKAQAIESHSKSSLVSFQSPLLFFLRPCLGRIMLAVPCTQQH